MPRRPKVTTAKKPTRAALDRLAVQAEESRVLRQILNLPPHPPNGPDVPPSWRVADSLGQIIEDERLAPALAAVIIREALKGDYRFMSMILDRLEGPLGKPLEPVESEARRQEARASLEKKLKDLERRLLGPGGAYGEPDDTDLQWVLSKLTPRGADDGDDPEG